MSVAGCGKDEPATPEAAVSETVAAAETEGGSAAEGLTGMVKETVETVEAGVAELSAQLTAKLDEADGFDGKTDKIIQKCPGCGLDMDGKSEHALKVAGYTLYFCAGDCKEQFAADVEKSIEKMKIPEP
jgi:YHS domain-containing protein